MPTEPAPNPSASSIPPRVTPEDLARFDDEDQLRRASNDARLRDEQPPHHR